MLHGLMAELAGEVAMLRWTGSDADRFRAQWRAVPAVLAADASRELVAAAASLRHQSAEQRATSAPDDSVAAAPQFARTVEMYRVEANVGGEVTGGLAFDLRVERLGPHTLRVTELVEVAGGIGVSPGNGWVVHTGEGAVGGGVLGSGGVSAILGAGRTWEIDDADLDGFIAAGIRDGLGLAPAAALLGSTPLGALARGVGLGGAWDTLAYRRPDPTATTWTIGAAGGVSGSAALPATGGRAGRGAAPVGEAAAEVEDVISVTRDAADGRITVGLGAEMSASIAASLPRSSSQSSVGLSSRIELSLDRHGNAEQLAMEQVVEDGDRVRVTRAVIDLEDPALGAAAGHVGDLLAGVTHGRPPDTEAVRSGVGRLLLLGAERAEVTEADYHVGASDTYGIEIPVGGVEVTRQLLDLRHRS